MTLTNLPNTFLGLIQVLGGTAGESGCECVGDQSEVGVLDQCLQCSHNACKSCRLLRSDNRNLPRTDLTGTNWGCHLFAGLSGVWDSK